MASNSISQPFVKCYYQFPLCFLTPCHSSVPSPPWHAGAAEGGQASSQVTHVTNLLVNTDTYGTEPSAGSVLLPEQPGSPGAMPRAPLPCPKHRYTMENWHCSVV